MSDKPISESRRGALKAMVGGLAAVPLMNLVGMAAAQAENLPHVDPESELAKGLKYKHKAEESERKDATQTCANCMLQQPATESKWVPCQIFPNMLVNSGGWCNSWTAKPKPA